MYIQTKTNHFTFDLCVMKKSSLVQTPKSIGGHVPARGVLINCSVSLKDSQVNFSLYFFNFNFNFYFADDEIDNAVQRGDLDFIKVFLAKRENKNPEIYTYKALGIDFTVLHRAAWYDHVNIAKWYREELDYPDINPLTSDGLYTPLSLAAELGRLNVVKYYIEAVGG